MPPMALRRLWQPFQLTGSPQDSDTASRKNLNLWLRPRRDRSSFGLMRFPRRVTRYHLQRSFPLPRSVPPMALRRLWRLPRLMLWFESLPRHSPLPQFASVLLSESLPWYLPLPQFVSVPLSESLP